MYNKFIKEDPRDIIKYLKYQKRIDDSFGYVVYRFHEGLLSNIIVIDFTTWERDSLPFIIDMNEYFAYYRKLKLNHLKIKINE